MNDLLSSNGISLKLAHVKYVKYAKYVKAIAYAKVKTDKVDSHILAQLLRMNFIPEAYKISDDVRPLYLTSTNFNINSLLIKNIYSKNKCLPLKNLFIQLSSRMKTFNDCSGFPVLER